MVTCQKIPPRIEPGLVYKITGNITEGDEYPQPAPCQSLQKIEGAITHSKFIPVQNPDDMHN